MQIRHAFWTAAALACGALLTAPAAAATLKGKFVYDGKAPAPVKLAVNRDADTCGQFNLVEEDLVVGKDGGLKNVVIWVRENGVKSPAPAEEKVVLDNVNCRFEPHVLVLHTDQILEVKNSDPVGHNANIVTVSNPAENVSVAANASQDVKKFSSEERLPTKVSCGIHPWMTAWVLIRGNTYAAVSGDDGSFEITGLPEGEEIEFQVWQEKAGYLSDVAIGGKDPKWTRGRVKVKMNGDVDLGEIKVSPKAFSK